MQTIARSTVTFVLLGLGLPMWLAGNAHAESGRAPVRDDQHKIEVYSESWKELKQRNVVMQNRDYSCGAAALATILRYYWGDAVTEDQIVVAILNMLTTDEIKDRMKNGLSITDLRLSAVKMGYLSSIGKMSFHDLSAARVPLVVPIRLGDYDHFVVYRGVADGRVYLADPIRGNVRPTIQEFCQQWQKNAVLAVAKPGVKIPEYSALSIRCNEVFLGEMTDQYIRRQLPGQLMPPTSQIVPPVPSRVP